ncbi:Gp61 [Mycolicibacterium canariasense]|uniref:Gp61 n=1 Tax=Mycolicibacterium canariasense TaxID=228230 RepID=A0A117I9X4_MYCCR|nr:hypothetical protein [Mycolicibacterium canariasense]MCV7212642.1 hypothetical protein [Mycolicibacterium canariasense]GAS95492.1 Gp61 [Mycolicibacterium canariasense]
MARIRTFKPEFFRSPDTAKASPQARILYMAMWSWANDEGIGETNLYGLLGFAFPDEDELTVKDLQRLLKEVRGCFSVVFYGNRGRFFYAIPSWDTHQKTERRAAGKFPKPDDPNSFPDLRFGDSGDGGGNSAPTEGSSSPGTGEQGNRGMQEPGNREQGTGEPGGGGSQVSHQGHASVPPPEKCPLHQHLDIPPSCGACGDARKAKKAWDAAEAKRVAAAAEDELTRRRATRKAIDDCPDCDQFGRLDDLTPCPKHPTLKEAANG